MSRLAGRMTSLRSRLALLLVLAIVGVVGLSALVSVQVLDRPDRTSFAAAFAEEVRIVHDILRSEPDAARRFGIEIGGEPQRGPGAQVRESDGISAQVEARGLDVPVRIVGDYESGARRLAFEFEPGRWAYLPYPGFPPRNHVAFISYLVLVVVGAVAVSLFAATKMTRPLRILDEAVGNLGPDGLPAPVPESGPAEMRHAARALNRLTARVRIAVESRMRLVAAAGHDLRTPMTRMRLRAEFLPDEEREVWLKDLEELDAIADSAIRLVREEVEPGAAEPVDLPATLRDIAGELEEIGRPVALGRIEGPATVLARPLAIKRALRNLVENAAIHGGGARISLARADGFAEIAIEDEGPGIPDDLIDRAFEPFFRVDPARRKIGPGAGLGLAIAKEIVERASGTLTLANRAPRGLSQVVRLPLAA